MPSLVVIAHRSSFPDPIQFSPGDLLDLGKRDEEYPGWIWVRDLSGREGVAPECFSDAATNGRGVALEQYDSTELDTSVGEQVTCIRELCSWVWVESEQGKHGWIPAKTIDAV